MKMDKMKIKYLKLVNRIPLNLKMIFLTVIVGLVAWAILDYVQTDRVRKIFYDQLNEKLSRQAIEDRFSFDNYVTSYNDSVKLFVSQNNFGDYIRSQKWSEKDNIEITYYRRPPEWFPGRTVLRTHLMPRFALLLDPYGRTREVYQSGPDKVDSSLLNPSPLLLGKSHGQSFMTLLDNVPYLITAESYFDSGTVLEAVLVFASPMDDIFLNNSLGIFAGEHLVALLTPEEYSHVLSSSNNKELPVGVLINSLNKRYLITGKEFFDYGASELQTQFASLVSKREVELLSKSVIASDRENRAISALAFILTFTIIMYWITGRIQGLTEKILYFSQKTLGIKRRDLPRGDQLKILEDSFQHLADELKTSQAQLIQSEKLSAMGRLAGGLAHELNSPLAGLLPMIEKYRDEAEKDSDAYIELSLMIKACNHMAIIIKDFGSFSRESKGLRTPLNLNEVIEDTLSFSTGVLNRNIGVFKDFTEKLPDINANKTELQQVILNMMTNARDAMPDGGKFIIKTGVSEDKNNVIMDFIDNGTGIKKENIEKLFDPFFTLKESGKGVGLGLSVSYGIIKNHGGGIRVFSEDGRGARFSIMLPVLTSNE